ncbi:hypothetical protein [Pseudomonas mosselii]|uniref:hypothetical protein n=1 Tax=Pseudomonas mosselii TaxID=78327 RepID=UPI00117A24EC|nr:hypothetical protein [Pseudomonas mosselii]
MDKMLGKVIRKMLGLERTVSSSLPRSVVANVMVEPSAGGPISEGVEFPLLEYTDPRKAIATKRRFSKPKIFIIDMPEHGCSALNDKWQDVSYGTLGEVYYVERSSSWSKIAPSHNLQGHKEADIVVVDLDFSSPSKKGGARSIVSEEQNDYWAKNDVGIADPRFFGAIYLRGDLERIVSSGGVCVIFADKINAAELSYGRVSRGTLVSQREVHERAWSFLPIFDDFKVVADEGENITVKRGTAVAELLEKYLPGARYTCVLDAGYYSGHWEVLAHSKFSQPVALMRQQNAGWVIVVPQLKDKVGFVDELLSAVLPGMVPGLFPEAETGAWRYDNAYELQQIIDLKEKKKFIEDSFAQEISAINDEIDACRAKQGWVHDLLDGTGDRLVEAVKNALGEIGFVSVIDMDVLRDAENKQRREDLRIMDRSPLLIVDVKGVSGAASDADSTQASKHAMINMREMKRTDVQGLSIINSYRNLPPLSRDRQVFRQEIIEVAHEVGLGLMSSADLYKLLLGMRKYQWPRQHVMGVFYGQGVIEALPLHYEEIGVVGKVFSEIIGVYVRQGEICVGDHIALVGPLNYYEVHVESIKVEEESVPVAKAGDKAGFNWPRSLFRAREGMLVYRISKDTISSNIRDLRDKC